ncbi:FAD-binding oxidoreductase [Streptomyces sp. A1-5]|uniref:FAD-binding oxidoreductase n=1 Tax=Streptomyces sp. A1-5 TaxID=2738410 RepID=UPI001F2D226E|nr:FAD-binding oxidoreductase [Streptomyces sp. A1-5]UJB39665.1 FAD-binding oxidoreductase [Streptomyces sp. A1-5]
MPTILRSPSGPAGGTLPGFASVDGGLVVDLSVMRSVRVDVDEQTAWVQGGANGADLHAETLTYGLAGIAGWTNAVGLGGFLLHGGYGCLSAKLGLGVDTILELEVVSANGEVLRVTPSENPDLFWAARGAGSNFGVVTWMKVQLVPVPEQVLAGVLVYDAVEATELLEHLNELNGRVPDDMMFIAHMAVLPDDPAYPGELHGKLVVDVMIVHVGSLAQAGADVRGLREEFAPLIDTVAPRSLRDFMTELSAGYPGIRQRMDDDQVVELSDEVIDVVVSAARTMADRGLQPMSYLIMYPYRGAASRTPEHASACPVGRGHWSITGAAFWEDPADDARHIGWCDDVSAALHDGGVATGAVYANCQPEVNLERQRRSFGEERWNRLASIKAKYDPENVFHHNHNIPPAS